MKVLFVGLGSIGQRHLRNLRAILGDRLKPIAWRRRGLARVLSDSGTVIPQAALEQEFGIRNLATMADALAERPDAAVIASPTRCHISDAMDIVQAGVPLLLEKPVSDRIDGLDRLSRILKDRRGIVLVAYQMRFHPLLLRLREIVRTELVGRITAARAEIAEALPSWHPYEDYRTSYAARRDLGGGSILTQIHEIDYMKWLLGRPRRLLTVGGHLSRLEVDTEDTATTLMAVNCSGRLIPVAVHQDYVQRPPARSCQVIGDAGKVHVDLIEHSLRRWDDRGNLVEHLELKNFHRDELYLREMKHFLDCVEGKAEPIAPLSEGISGVEIALAARESMEAGRIVELGQEAET
jgi:predicted dehydrogenase